MSTSNSADTTVRPTKKQRDILIYIEQFIDEHGYSPSYREIMNGLQYTSVATVSLHVNSLIRRGHLRKRDRSARSLEVVSLTDGSTNPKNPDNSHRTEPDGVSWLIEKIEALFAQFEATASEQLQEHAYDDMAVLVNALRVLELPDVAGGFMSRLAALRERIIGDVDLA